jgi:hypothetical protein
MTKTRKERDQGDDLPDTIDFKGLPQEQGLGQGGLLKQLAVRVFHQVLEAEMTESLGYKKHDNAGDRSENSRERQGTFEPEILPKYRKRMPLFNDRIISIKRLGRRPQSVFFVFRRAAPAPMNFIYTKPLTGPNKREKTAFPGNNVRTLQPKLSLHHKAQPALAGGLPYICGLFARKIYRRTANAVP